MHVCKDILIFPNCCYFVNNLLFVNLFPQLRPEQYLVDLEFWKDDGYAPGIVV